VTSVSGLSDAHRSNARRLAMQAAFLGLAHAPVVHYTQGPRRWDGINRNLKAWRGQYPTFADCSAFATWCIWNGLDHYGVRDTVNASNWQAGYTGTMLEHGKVVQHEENVLQGDLVLYGNRGTSGKHVAICVGGGKVISHGSEGGPYLLPIHYRSDVIDIRRYI
jgi:cell wall-associated NlpC family hydrolase